jgi:hypothetical protein
MASVDLGKSLGSTVTSAQSAMSSISGVASTVGKLAGALNNLSNPAALVSSLRSLSLPKGGESSVQLANAAAQFGGADTSGDWRVRLSIPTAFNDSPILQPLRDAGGLVFPYTPSIQISSSANYADQAITHQNYQFIHYQNSRADQIQITAPFNVEDGAQALYWLAAIHMLRSSTKMFTGNDPAQGNPPPLLKLNGYGDYVFKNVPVVVKSFSVDLPQDVNYINTSTAGLMAAGAGPMASIAGVAATTTRLAGLAGALGKNKLASQLGKVGAVGGAIAGVGKLLGGSSLLGGGLFASPGNSWVPTKSSISLTLQPIYSRESMRQFSLKTFVNGGYITGGYI